MPDASIAFIGGGNMAGALIGGLLRSGRSADSLIVVEPSEPQRQHLHQQFDIRAEAQASSTLAQAGVVVWAVKPQIFTAAAAPCAPWVAGALQFSVMAGVRSQAIAEATGSLRVVRAMPNTPALIGQGITGLFARAEVDAAGRTRVEAMLSGTGAWLWLNDESKLDAVTALSGSGPAYVFYFIEAMMQAGVEMGLSEAQSRQLAQATFAGATALAGQSPDSPADLRARVTSPNGTTQAAIAALDAAGVAGAFIVALHAAHDRARQLGDELAGSPGS